ncbi:unnamed protein product [Moneuplotes crassus]|uniref:Uncharacterized protein n=1 Tax=Euplotes crassus TaxID=5936 RepID=A0AAD1U981_EUPCR|nr:unnamed protein product [Moneuplotes crassus]
MEDNREISQTRSHQQSKTIDFGFLNVENPAKTYTYKRRMFGMNSNQRWVSPDQIQGSMRGLGNYLTNTSDYSNYTSKDKKKFNNFRLGKVCENELSLTNLYSRYKPSDSEDIEYIPFDQIMKSKLDPEKTLEELVIKQKQFISPRSNRQKSKKKEGKEVLKIKPTKKVKRHVFRPRKYTINSNIPGSAKNFSGEFFGAAKNKDQKKGQFCSLVDKGEKQYVVLNPNYNPQDMKDLKSRIYDTTQNRYRKILSQSPKRGQNRVKFNIKLPINSKIKETLPVWKKHKVLVNKSAKNKADKHKKTNPLNDVNSKVMYEGVEIVDYNDIYEFLNFRKETPKISLGLITKFRNREALSFRNSEFDTLTRQKPTLSKRMRRKNTKKIDDEFFNELQKHQVVKNRWESRLGDKLLLIDKMDSYEPQKRVKSYSPFRN